MIIKVKNEKFNGERGGFQFENGVAKVEKGDEKKAEAVAKHLRYEIVKEKTKKAPKQESKKDETESEDKAESESKDKK